MEKFVKSLKEHKKSIYSQNGEDGILLEIFNKIGTTNKYFVEFGAWDGVYLSNTANLRINHGWKGILLEGDVQKISTPEITHGFITPENINDIFEKNMVPKEFDLLSIDIDGDDYWCWKACNYSPRVVVIEFQSSLDPTIPMVSEKGRSSTKLYPACIIPFKGSLIEFKEDLKIVYSYIDRYSYFGSSISALKNLGECKGYSLVFRSNQQNLIFIKSDLLNEEERNIPLEMFINKDNEKIYHDGVYKSHWNEFSDNKLWEYFKLDYSKNWIMV